MDFGCGGSAGGSGGDESGQGTSGSGGIKRKWGDLETTMKAMKDALVAENEEKSAKIRKLMEENVTLKQDNVRLEETVLRLENLPFQELGPIRPLGTRPNPFDVFPPEVWNLIIEKITRSSDLEMLCLAFPQLEQMVKNLNKTTFLFEKVIPLISKKLDLNDILNCRLVCDKWNQDLCALLANSNAQSRDHRTTVKPTSYCGPSFSLSPKYSKVYRFDRPEKIQRFLDKMSDHPGNPLFGRFLRFSVRSQTDVNNFWKSAMELVKKYGEHVCNFEIAFHRKCYDLIDFYKGLQQLLLHLSNLKNLQVSSFLRGNVPSEVKMNLAAQFWNSPLPPLPYLQSLTLALPGETGMVNAFTPYLSPQIYRLELLTLRQTWGDALKAESFHGLINLEYLEIELRSNEDVLRLIEFPNENLKKLSLRYSNVIPPLDPDSFSSKQLASLSEKFSRLEHLNLVWCNNRKFNSFLGSKIWLTGLKTLEIAVGIGEHTTQHDLDFILRLSSLKHLVIVIFFNGRIDFDEYDKNSVLKIRKYLHEGHMLDSNIWTLIPSLQLLETWTTRAVGGIEGSGIFTREMFENRVG